MTEKNNDDKFVTFKWLITTLIGAVLSVILIMGTFTTIIVTTVSSRIDSKVDKELFAIQSAAIQKSFDIQTQNIACDVGELKGSIKDLFDYVKANNKLGKVNKP